MLSCAAIAADLYSASVLDNATVGCLLLHHDIAPIPRLKKYLVVDRRVPQSPA